MIHHFRKRKVVVNDIDEIWAADLVDMQSFSKFNNGIKYLLMVIDVFSKYGWIVPLKSKTGVDVANALGKIFEERRCTTLHVGALAPMKMWTDKGKEFYNKHVKVLGVQLYSTENEEKSSVVERWDRTMKEKMFKYFSANNTKKYINVLDEMVNNYNNTKHSSIKMTPVEASDEKNKNKVWMNLNGKARTNPVEPKFSVGDKVRITKKKSNFESRIIFDENLIAIHMKRTKLVYNKPIYLGMCILDLSKTLMFEFHYDYIKNKYSDRAKLLMTDTDSLIYEIKTDDFYNDIAEDVESKFDTSEFDKNHPAINDFGFKVGVNKKVIGMFKDETGGKQIEEFVGLRSKLYSYKLHEKEHKRCKGVKKSVVAKTITHEDYKNCLRTKNEQLRTMNVIRSHLHDIYTEQINKVALSADDDKRIILEDGVSTLAYGHYKIKS